MWELQWKMSFNPDPSKQTREFNFRIKDKNINHPPEYFSDNLFNQISQQKHLELIFYKPLSFENHIKIIPPRFCKKK